MMIREASTALTMPVQTQWLGDAESDFNTDVAQTSGPTPWVLAIRAIRAVSVPMGELRAQIDNTLNQVSNADVQMTDADLNTLQANVQQMGAYAAQLPTLIRAAKSLPEYTTDAATANELNNWLVFVQDWAGSTMASLGMLPTDLANYLGTQIANIGTAAAGAGTTIAFSFLPLAALLIGGIFLLEKSRTYRKVVA